ncbi:MAG: GspH/FimT family pseudopilin [Xanthomonadales bacterium]|jgi:type IV fimbrial biogenesis protein FimT|nr:GspH/FimT family pseudopilin [Xanthomonadales bacterium]
MRRTSQRGFTVIELMITVALAAVLLAVALPNFSDALVRSRVAGAADELQSALSLARAEALKLKLPVTLCARATGTTCNTGTSWNAGFLLFQDPNGNGLPDEGELILRDRPFDLPNVGVTSTTPSVSFTGNGRVAGGATRTFEVAGAGCSLGSPTGAELGKRRQLAVAASGRTSGRRLACG